jgi:SAM-dependent methyltransferase
MRTVEEREQWLRAFHDARPGITARAFGRGGSYERLAARVPKGRVLDLACGDGTLLELLGPRAIGIDISRAEIERARQRTGTYVGAERGSPKRQSAKRSRGVAQARAQQLPFGDRTFDAATCHLAFMLFDDIPRVVAELARVLKPGAPFVALLGGGPTADGDDAFHHFASLLPTTMSFGDRRASTEDGWRELFAGWRAVTFERRQLDLGGTFDEVWTFLASSYQLRDHACDHIRAELRSAFPGSHVPCDVATYLATVTR